MTNKAILSLEDKAQMIRDVKSITFRSGSNVLTAQFFPGGRAFICIDAVRRTVSNPGSFLYALAGEKETFEVLLTGDDKHSPGSKYLTQIKVIYPNW